jgi:SSS family solute:Na+ symporter
LRVSLIDYAVIATYFAAVIGLGFWYRKRASESLEAYFLGGKRLHWLALAMSGSVSTFDITGTMWIVSLLFVAGMRSMWNHWMWGWMMGAFFLAYMGKWVQRSGVMTGAQWMATRFGEGTGGRVARMAYAFMAVLTQATFIGYAFQGIGKFAAVYIDLSPAVCALIVIGTTTLYVLLGGLYSVVVTDVVQTVILTIAGLVIAGVAFVSLSPETLEQALPEGWASVAPRWRMPDMADVSGYEAYEWFGALAIVWVLKGLMLNAGGPAQMYDFQRFLAARSPRDAAKLGAAWSAFLVVRWAMCAGIVLLALAGITNVTDPEQVMPMVLRQYLPVGVRGLVVAGLLAAFMSTFSSTVNSGASYIVRDFWQALVVPNAGQRHLVRAGYVATLAIVGVGVLIGTQATSIKQIWDWLMMALGAGVVVPNVLRWYWWRMNGWGYAAGTLGGIALATVPLVIPEWPLYVSFPIICVGSLAGSVAVTLLTRPVAEPILVTFYQSVRPFGAWGPVRRETNLPLEAQRDPSESPRRAIVNVLVAMVAITGLYLGPMYLVGHWYARAGVWLGAAAAAIGVLTVTWYRHLPAADKASAG